MQRRTFLRHLAVSPLATASISGISCLSAIRNVMAASGKTLIVVFQRGGCDGLNTIVPFGDDEYYNLRPNIALAPPGSSSSSAINIDGFFGFHPALLPFKKIFDQGDMAILPTVHYQNGNRSHFSSQDFIESGISGKSLPDGWLNRHLTSSNGVSSFRAVSIGGLSHSLRGKAPFNTISDLAKFDEKAMDEKLSAQLTKILQQPNKSTDINRKLLSQHGHSMLDNIELLASTNYSNYKPSNGANYPGTNYGQQLRQAAHLIKSGLGLEVCTINQTGWDDHASQGGAEGAQAKRLEEFSTGIEALYTDLSPTRMNDVVILTMTEFGRTAKQNANNGTDHGNASSWFTIGKGINGGVFGEWPGLQPENLYLGRYLKHTIDFRDIFAEVIKNHLGNADGLAAVLPGHHYQPIGFL